MGERTQYYALDIAKFIFSYLVIAIHVNAFFPVFTPVSRFICDLAVPVFFIISGFLLDRKFHVVGGVTFSVVRKYCTHVLRLYLIYNILYLIEGIVIYPYHSFNAVPTLVAFLLHGSMVYAWHLWYLLGLFQAVVLMYLLIKCRIPLKFIFAIALLVYFVGCFLVKPMAGNSMEQLGEAAHSEFLVDVMTAIGFVQNGLFTGFPFVCLGFAIQKLESRIKTKRFIFLLLAIAAASLFIDLDVARFITAGAIVSLLALPRHSHLSPFYLRFRSLSSLNYYLHLLIVFPVCIFFGELGFWNAFLLSSLVATIVSIILNREMPKHGFLRKMV